MILNVCSDPNFLSVLIPVRQVIKLIQIGAPLCLIIMLMIDVLKAVISNPDKIKSIFTSSRNRLISAAMIFLVPAILEFLISALALTNLSYTDCLTNANQGTVNQIRINKAEEAVVLAEKEKTGYNVREARILVYAITSDDELKKSLGLRLDAVEEKIEADKRAEEEANKPSSGDSNDDVDDFVTKDDEKDASSCTDGVVYPTEVSPSLYLDYWDEKKALSKTSFILPKDEATGQSLGIWPKNHQSIQQKLSNPKVYGGAFIWPVTPFNGTYTKAYEHPGIDIGASFGMPIYAPASGTIIYSKWGGTANNGCDETPYSVVIELDRVVTIKQTTSTSNNSNSYVDFNDNTGSGTKKPPILNKPTKPKEEDLQVKYIFMTHLSGTKYRCSRNACNIRVERGDLIGYIGTASGSATSNTGSFAQHLHMSFYNLDGSKQLSTTQFEKLYQVTTGSSKVAGG